MMDLGNLRAVDHARAMNLAIGIAADNDEMVVLALTDAASDPHPAAEVNVSLALGASLVQMLGATIGPDATEGLLRRTLAQLRGAADEDSGT